MEILKFLYSTTLILFTSSLLFQCTAYSASFQATTNLKNPEKSAAIKQTASDQRINEKVYALYQNIEIGMTLEEVERILGGSGVESQVARQPDGDIITSYTWYLGRDSIGVQIGADGVELKFVCCSQPVD